MMFVKLLQPAKTLLYIWLSEGIVMFLKLVQPLKAVSLKVAETPGAKVTVSSFVQPLKHETPISFVVLLKVAEASFEHFSKQELPNVVEVALLNSIDGIFEQL